MFENIDRLKVIVSGCISTCLDIGCISTKVGEILSKNQLKTRVILVECLVEFQPGQTSYGAQGLVTATFVQRKLPTEKSSFFLFLW
jgi:hypothetical protein